MEVGLFSRQCLGKTTDRRYRSLGEKQARAWNRRVNKDKATIQWKFTRRQAEKHFTTQSHGQSTRATVPATLPVPKMAMIVIGF